MKGMTMNRMKLETTEAEAQELRRRVRSKTAPVRDRQRARIVLLALEGRTQENIAREVKVSRVTVSTWLRRFGLKRLAGLVDAPGRGRKPWLPEAKLKRVLDEASKPPATLGRWSCRTMGRAVGISKASVQRLWSANDVKPHLTRTFKLSKDKRFVEKLTDVVGVYLNPPDKAVVKCVDEKPRIQALDRTQPGLPMKKGRCGEG
jgi:transposase